MISTTLSKLVYNFRKKIPGVKTHKNIKYKEHGTKFHKFDIHFEEKNLVQKPDVPIIVYFHGGGWTNYNNKIYTTLTRRLADMGYVVFNANYRLAPKYKLDDIVDDAINAVIKATQLASNYGANPNKIILAGDSAGAHIAAMLVALAKNGDERIEKYSKKIKALACFYGVFDLVASLSSGFPNIRTYLKACTHAKYKTKEWYEELKKFSVFNYDTSDFPPCFFASGEIDKLHKDQTLALVEQLLSQGVKCHNVFFDKYEFRALHAFMIIDGLSTNVEVMRELEKFLLENVKK